MTDRTEHSIGHSNGHSSEHGGEGCPDPLVPSPEDVADGRQSERALAVRRGTMRLLSDLGFYAVAEVTLITGRRADLVAIDPKGQIWIIEIKSSLADLRADTKWTDYRRHCDQLYFATLSDVDQDSFPGDAGFIVADAYGADMLREAPQHPLSGAARKSVLIRTARQAASRLMRAQGVTTSA